MEVLHVPYTYFPDPCGGTEIYVQALARRLSEMGIHSSIAAPGAVAARYQHDGIDVHRFATDPSANVELAYGTPDRVAAKGFREIVDEVGPQIVHLHARSAAVSESVVDIAHGAGAGVVLTYHTPTVSCVRGSMMLFGEEPCDGVIERRRCSACVMSAHGVPKWIGTLCAGAPLWLSPGVVGATCGSKVATVTRIPGLIGAAQERFYRLMGKVDHIVAVCQWVEDVLLRNDVPASKITLSRQGIVDRGARSIVRGQRDAGLPLSLAYFGRTDRTKGIDILIRALALIPEANLRVEIFAINQSGGAAEFDWITNLAASDPRVVMRSPVDPYLVQATMTSYDFIVIPSRWLETGPLVALEAFAAGTPVLGSNLGGIAELVRDGVDGVLVEPDDLNAWAQALESLSGDTESVEAMRANIRPPRSADASAEDMVAIYDRLLFSFGI